MMMQLMQVSCCFHALTVAVVAMSGCDCDRIQHCFVVCVLCMTLIFVAVLCCVTIAASCVCQ